MNLPDGLFGLSQDQEIIPLEEEDLKRDLPLVTGLAPLSGSEKENQSICPYKRWANAKAKFALDFYKTLLEEDSSLMGIISEMSLFEENNLILYLIPRGIQVNMGEGNFKKKLKRVKAILEYEGKRDDLACIDLRFKDQVVLTRSSPGMPQSSSQKPNNQVAQMRGKAFGGKENL
jgi:hypothetical protein